MHQAGHVEEVLPADDGDEVVGEPQLDCLAVDGGRHEKEARLGAEERQGGRQVLADAAARTTVALHQGTTQQHTQDQPLHSQSRSCS